MKRMQLYTLRVGFIVGFLLIIVMGCGKHGPLQPDIENTEGNNEPGQYDYTEIKDPFPNLPGFGREFVFDNYRLYSEIISDQFGGVFDINDPTGSHRIVYKPDCFFGFGNFQIYCKIGDFESALGKVLGIRFEHCSNPYVIQKDVDLYIDAGIYSSNLNRSNSYLGGLEGAYLYLRNGCSDEWRLVDSTNYDKPNDRFHFEFDYFCQYAVVPKWENSGESRHYSSADTIDGAEGGRMNIDQDEGCHSLDIQQGSFNGDREITCEITTYNTVEGETGVFEFGPEGLQFEKPVDFTVDVSVFNGMENSSSIVIYYYNENIDKWELLGVDHRDGGNTVNFQLNHFSRYTISGKRTL